MDKETIVDIKCLTLGYAGVFVMTIWGLISSKLYRIPFSFPLPSWWF